MRKVVTAKKEEEVFIADLNLQNIYAYKDHTSFSHVRILSHYPVFFYWIYLITEGFCRKEGTFYNIIDAIIHTIEQNHTVYEFTNQKEFLEWALDQ